MCCIVEVCSVECVWGHVLHCHAETLPAGCVWLACAAQTGCSNLLRHSQARQPVTSHSHLMNQRFFICFFPLMWKTRLSGRAGAAPLVTASARFSFPQNK